MGEARTTRRRSVSNAQGRDGSKLDGDIHIWKVDGEFPMAECGYVPELDEETGDIVHPKPSFKDCKKCQKLTAPKPIKKTKKEKAEA